MGLFDNIASALRETNEHAHGVRLKKDVFLTLDLIHSAGPQIETESLRLFQQLQADILSKCNSWSRDGKLKVAAQLQSKAREHKDFDIGQAYGYYLASAFLESMVRESADARMTFLHLGTIAVEIEKQVLAQTRTPSRSEKSPDIFKLADICMTAILITVFWPSNSEPSTEDFFTQIERLTVDEKIIIVCVAFGVIDGLGQRLEASQAATLATAVAFLSSKLNYVEEVIPGIIKDLVRHSELPGTKKYENIRLGGTAAVKFFDNPKDFQPLTECGNQVRELIDANPLW